MARDTPSVRAGVLHLSDKAPLATIPVGSEPWWDWLADAATTRFNFATDHLNFTARRERRSGGWYWYAFRTLHRTLHKVYLGKGEDLTLERLSTAASSLAHVDAPPLSVVPSSGGPAPGAPTVPSPAARLWPAPLLSTKLGVPRTRPDLVPRPRLTARLAVGLSGPLTLICAPAGFGKTTLLADWLYPSLGGARTREGPSLLYSSSVESPPFAVAWLSLDDADNDPIQFLRYLVAALQTAIPTIGVTMMASLESPQPPPMESLLAVLLNDLATSPYGWILALDDYHVLRARPIHQALTFLLDHGSSRLHLVIATREDPPLPLARLRARGELCELRAADLRFTAAEAATFLGEMMGLDLSPADVAALEERTEGWIAGLQLAALSMRDRTDVSSLIAAFSGSNRYILDYLTEEVLTRQTQEMQSFLLRTSILDRLCGSLCDAVLDDGPRPVIQDRGAIIPDLSSTSDAMLRRIEGANLFLSALDTERCWYRYHHLFADLLRARLQAEPDLACALHQRASAWYEQHGLLEEAVRHAVAAPDLERAATLIERYGTATILGSSQIRQVQA